MTSDFLSASRQAIRAILSSAQPFVLEVAGSKVECTVTRGVVAGDGEDAEGLPPPVDVDCAWEGGAVRLRLYAAPWGGSGPLGDHLGLRVQTRDRRELVWINVSAAVKGAAEGAPARLHAHVNLFVRRDRIPRATADRMRAALRDLARDSGLPLASETKVEVCQLEAASGEVVGAPDQAFQRLVHAALLKLDFLARGESARARGRPLVDLQRWDINPEALDLPEEDISGGDGEDEERPAVATAFDLPLNLILYGPPGTGKTHHIQSQFAPLFNRGPSEQRSAGVSAELVQELKFYQAVAVALHELGGRARVDALVEHRLVKAKYAAQRGAGKTKIRNRVWSTLGHHTVEGSTTVQGRQRFGELLFDKEEDGTWRLAAPLPDELIEMGRQIQRSRSTPAANHIFITFHQAYGYEDFIEGIRPRLAQEGDDEPRELGYVLEDGVFLQAVRAAVAATGFEGTLQELCELPREERRQLFEGASPYAIFIDEINRGNVARSFGELISLIEEDKRLGAEHELMVRLPYSRTLFGVPKNLYLIGTMNTADRSVEALDAALRRRFEFQEMRPDLGLLDFEIAGGVHVGRMLQVINQRLERLADRDRSIGHSYFLPLRREPTLEALKRVFARKIMPLLQEYFFGDWGKIGLVLGRDFVDRRRDMVELAEVDHEDRDLLAEKPSWTAVDVSGLSSHAFRRIYERV